MISNRFEESTSEPPGQPPAGTAEASVAVDEDCACDLAGYCLQPARATLPTRDGGLVRVTADGLRLVDADGNGLSDTLVGRFSYAVPVRGRLPSMDFEWQRRVTREVLGRLVFGEAGWPKFRGQSLVTVGPERRRA